MTAAATPGREKELLALAKEIHAQADNLSPENRTHPAGVMIKWAKRLRHLAAKPADEGWRSMETAPKEGIFLAKMHDGREPPNPYYEIIGWNDHGGDNGAWMNDSGSEYHKDAEASGYCRPLGWMPLPPLSTTEAPKPATIFNDEDGPQ